ncbi:probable Rho GTPase-activating protein CG5521 isoform X1 [Tribolium castaneum]|uniref:probable Rho GTPase-activating protein CG5521 isoform X1 n=1 Tax=Tribolium castaneum TaxID=7070 RepID=UPI00046BF3D2|nr:PREDICTED: probable Rho GTPase-activating protein CG5521 isoform X1 [Tribolium castaneum]|eukprot:XP_008195928.1 PREDICTED: probable Rho GTPase-activating protein CG5521 isoform X1 [Tribolium castaneum]
MFSKRNLVDVKKSTSKIQDPKKDLATRIKHLKIILDNVDIAEAKGLFEANFSHVYNILYDSFIQAEGNLRQRELSFHLVHKAHKEELECTLWILEQVLCLLPELIHKRWQLHSLGRILSKLLHPGNSVKLRRQAIRYFLMWYQALNDNAPDYVHNMFQTLVPGFNSPSSALMQISGSVFHDTSAQNPVTASELLPVLPPSGGEKAPEHQSKFYLEALLEHMVHTVIKLEWHDKAAHHHRCFHFLLEKFKSYYLMKICPSFSHDTSLYTPNLELPVLRKPEAESEFILCRVALIMWVANHLHQPKKNADGGPASITHSASAGAATHEEEGHESAHASLESTISIQTNKTASDEELANQIVREVLCSSRDNVNFIHEIYRQAFLINFSHVVAIRKIIAVYKDLIQLNVPEVPSYMLEPAEDAPRFVDDGIIEGMRPPRLRNDSYLGAIHRENLLVRAGMQNILQLFMTHAANVFLLEVNPHIPKMLEEQTDACKRVLNIYRYMVMNTRMDSSTWEQLLLVLLQITSLVLGENPPKKKMNTLGGKLAPAIFQTLIVTWIKANLNVMISRELWDRFLLVLTSLTSWEELIKEWAKTMETLTRVLARHVYNLDLTDLPLDRLMEQKSKRGRRSANRPESTTQCNINDHSHISVCRQDSSLPDGNVLRKKVKHGLTRSHSETSLNVKRRSSQRQRHTKHRRSLSLDNIPQPDTESTDRTRSPSPAPSSGLESNSIKDSPIQLDVLSTENSNSEPAGEHRGVVCGGSIRGWLPDVAVILWRRMLGALGDVNTIADPKLHAQVFEYLVKLSDTLIKIKQNQGISADNQSTPPAPELIPPLTLILPWCFGALMLPDDYEAGKLNALRLLCTITVNCDHKRRNYLPQFYRFLHMSLVGNSKPFLNTTLKFLGPRFLSLQLPGFSLLLLDLIHACNTVLNSMENLEGAPRTEAISIIANLLSLPGDLSSISVLQPEDNIHVRPCPDVKEHVVSILLRAGRREPKGKARCIALSALGMFVYKELTNQTFHPKVADAINVLLLALKFNNKIIAQLASNILFLLCDHASLLWTQYPRLGNAVIRTLCAALFRHAPLGSTAGESDKALGTALLLCLGEWCMRLEPRRLLEVSEYGEERGTCLLLQVFTVLYKIAVGKTSTEHSGGLSQPSLNEDFDPNILSDDLVDKSSPSLSPTKNHQCQKAITLCAKTVLSHLVTHLGHFPMAIGAARLSSLVVEHDDVPNLSSDELSANIFSAPNIQLFMLTENVIASLIELPVLDLPGGGVTAGLSTADKQVRVLLRDLSGKASWDASILYRTPDTDNEEFQVGQVEIETNASQGKWGPMSLQPESFIGCPSNLPQRAMRHRSPNVLPDVSNSAPDLDQLDDLLQYLGHTSPECLENFDRKLNEPALPPLSIEIEQEAIASVINQRNLEVEENRVMQFADSMLGQPISRPNSRNEGASSPGYDSSIQQVSSGVVEQNAFQQCRLLFSQLGLAGWERRQQLHLLNKTERLLRELRNLDSQRCRETHKVAVIYVAPGQEDKNSILSNQGGSAAYEQFLAALAWEVELEGHTGFLGGLQRQGSTGLTAPYVATSFSETIFHVATRMPGDTPETVLNKTRHLGNDEVHIVWSEHCRDYRRDIIPTEFCDILITIYPLGSSLNRVTVNCKPDVPHFGILFHEAIVESNVLAGLVRATAICASRAKRTTLPFYQQYYEERAMSLETVVTKHKHSTTYEDFISRVYSPIATPSPFCVSGSTSSGAGDGPACTGNPSMLAAALLDSHGHSHKPNQRNDSKFRVSASDAARGVWFNNSPDMSQNVESTSISPRPLKKISSSLKSVPRRSLRQEAQDSPPESPQQTTRKK